MIHLVNSNNLVIQHFLIDAPSVNPIGNHQTATMHHRLVPTVVVTIPPVKPLYRWILWNYWGVRSHLANQNWKKYGRCKPQRMFSDGDNNNDNRIIRKSTKGRDPSVHPSEDG